MKNPIACIVVWYNPNLSNAIESINSYVEDVETVYVVDNSDLNLEQNINALNGLANVKYIGLNQNMGIAHALNVGFQNAINDGFEYVLTMDQDSKASDGMIEKLYTTACDLNNSNNGRYGIIAAQPDTPQRAPRIKSGISNMDSVITSGNLVYCEAYSKVGGFKDSLFIDYVDCWFSLDLRRSGYKVIQVNDAILMHNLGDIVPERFLGVKMFPTNHSSLRHYYISRNRRYLRDEFRDVFPEFLKWERKNYLKVIIKLLLFEKQKLKKIKMILRGRDDYHHSIKGKFNA